MMNGLLETRSEVRSPFATRMIESRYVPLEEAERDALCVFYGRMTRQTLAAALIAIFFLFVMGYGAVNARSIPTAAQFRAGGAVVLFVGAAALAYVGYEYQRKQRVFILSDSFAIERRFNRDVELIQWNHVAKLYCLDRTTETRLSIYFIPVGSSRSHRGRLRVVLLDGRELILTNRVRDFSAMAAQFVGRTLAVQQAPCTTYLIDGGVLDFDRFRLSRDGLNYKGKPLPWSDIEQITIDRSGTLKFQTGKRWRSPRFSADALPNAALLLRLLSIFGHDVREV